MAEKDPRALVLEKVEKAGVAMLTTLEGDGTIVSRPMGVQDVEDDGTIWFITRASSDVAQDGTAGRRVNVTVQEKGFWASIAGTGTLVRDDARKREFWNPATEAFFGEGTDPEDPQIVLVRVQAESAEYWNSAAGGVSALVEIVKAKATGGEARPGDHDTVEFSAQA